MEGNTLNDSPSGTLDHSPCRTHVPVKEINTLVCLPMHKTWRSPQCEGFSDIHTGEGSNSPVHTMEVQTPLSHTMGQLQSCDVAAYIIIIM